MVPKAMLDMVLDQLSMLREQLSRMQETIEKLVEDNRKKDAIIEEKNQIILNANRARFGQSSEQRKYVLSDGQVSMFEITGDGNSRQETESEKSTEGNNTVTVAAHTRKAKRTMEELCAGLPVEEGGPHDGYQQDIQGREEGPLPGGGVLEPGLLKTGGHRHRCADEKPAEKELFSPLPGGGQGRFAPKVDEGHEEQGPHQHPHGGEGVGGHAQVHGGGLGHEGAAPDHGTAQQNKAVFCLLHGDHPITARAKTQDFFPSLWYTDTNLLKRGGREHEGNPAPRRPRPGGEGAE